MTTPLMITSLNQGKIYKDWTLETVDDTPFPSKTSVIARAASSLFLSVRSWLKSHIRQSAAATRFTAWHAH